MQASNLKIVSARLHETLHIINHSSVMGPMLGANGSNEQSKSVQLSIEDGFLVIQYKHKLTNKSSRELVPMTMVKSLSLED